MDNFGLRTTAAVPAVNFNRSESYDRIIGFHDLLAQIANSDQERDVRIPVPFAGIRVVRGITQEGSLVMPRNIGIRGEYHYGHTVSYNENMQNFDFHKYQEQVLNPKRIYGFFDFSGTQGYREDPSVVSMETFMVVNSYIRYFRQVVLNLFIREISTKTQLVGTYDRRIFTAPTTANFNVALNGGTELDLSAVTDGATSAAIYNAASAVCKALYAEYQFRGEYPVVLIPSKVWYLLSDGIRRELNGLLLREDIRDVFLSNTQDRKLTLYNTFFFNNVWFVGVPEVIVPDFSVTFDDVVGEGSGATQFPQNYDEAFPNNKGVAFFPSGVCMSEQSYELLIGINRVTGIGLGGGVAINPTAFASGRFNLDANIKMHMMDSIATSRIYSDFAQRNLVTINGAPPRAYTQVECCVRSDNKDIVNNMRTKMVTFTCNDIIKPNAVNTIKLA